MGKKICKDWRGWDKILHIAVCLAIGLVCAGIFSFIPFSPWWAAFLTLSIVMAFGIGKELRDNRQKGNHFCIWDIAADLLAAIVSAVVAWLANYYCIWAEGVLADPLATAAFSPFSVFSAWLAHLC